MNSKQFRAFVQQTFTKTCLWSLAVSLPSTVQLLLSGLHLVTGHGIEVYIALKKERNILIVRLHYVLSTSSDVIVSYAILLQIFHQSIKILVEILTKCNLSKTKQSFYNRNHIKFIYRHMYQKLRSIAHHVSRYNQGYQITHVVAQR